MQLINFVIFLHSEFMLVSHSFPVIIDIPVKSNYIKVSEDHLFYKRCSVLINVF
jgi:hypothetical protein